VRSQDPLEGLRLHVEATISAVLAAMFYSPQPYYAAAACNLSSGCMELMPEGHLVRVVQHLGLSPSQVMHLRIINTEFVRLARTTSQVRGGCLECRGTHSSGDCCTTRCTFTCVELLHQVTVSMRLLCADTSKWQAHCGQEGMRMSLLDTALCTQQHLTSPDTAPTTQELCHTWHW
jgi:hypothetical protein